MDCLDGNRENAPEEDSGDSKMIKEQIDKMYFGAPEELAKFDFTSLKIVKIKKTPALPDPTL